MTIEMPSCLVAPGVGAAGEPDVVGVVDQRRVDLLPVDDEVVAVADRPGRQRPEVGAGVRLGVADREEQLTGEDPGQEEVLLLLRAELLDRGPTVLIVRNGTGAPARWASS
jgi:hypothetical protein